MKRSTSSLSAALLALAEGDQPPFETWSTLLLRSGILGARNGALVS